MISNSNMVDKNRMKICLYHFFNWIIYLGLVLASTFFMMDCLTKYRNSSTYYEVTNKKGDSIELPTLTLCFEPNFKESSLSNYNLSLFPKVLPENSNFTMQEMFEKSTYQIGKDFSISISTFNLGGIQTQIIKELGKAENSGESLFDYEIKAIISQKHGKCYEMILKPIQDILFAYLLVRVEFNKNILSKPEKLKVNNYQFQLNYFCQ